MVTGHEITAPQYIKLHIIHYGLFIMNYASVYNTCM